ncbi:LCP family glycopolymer transferase [Paenibacillus albus]|uniref:LCP family glycopolymer transferase n=1 Tax=Paenibacillus albus TaxID=2495582 RepID=UPI0013E04D55|nr:LCP family protein [Paenibacillus albus]
MLVLIGGGYLWFTLQRTMKVMYDPLPDKTWKAPAFERDSVAAALNNPEPTGETSIPAQSAGGDSALPNDHKASDGSSADKVDTTKNDNTQKYNNQSNNIPNNNKQLSKIEARKLSDEQVQMLMHPDLNKRDPFCLLLLGVDERAGDRGRSDTMILLSINPAKGSALAISIPRDTRLQLPKRESYDKINHAYAFGGTALSVEAVERLFGVPIAYYMKTNMEGIVDIVDTLGGVKVNNPWGFKFDDTNFPKGELSLDGQKALMYVRMRHEDPQGDFGRTQRQRSVLSALVDNVASVRSLGKLPHILSQLSKDVRTNLTSGSMFDLASNYRPEIENVDTLSLNGKGIMIKGIYYYSVTPEERGRIQNIILDHVL